MPKWVSSRVKIRGRLSRSFSHLVTGGDWALALPEKTRQNLRWFWYDGLFSSASDNIIITYITLYVLALGATRAQIGIMSALSSLSATLLLLPGAMLVERFGHRREITLLFGGGIARLAILVIALIPFGLNGTALALTAMALSITRDAFANLSFPAWLSFAADIVPMEGRGRYFGSRNFIMGITGMLTVLLVGALITRLRQPEGYQLGMALAFVLGTASTFSFSRLHDPAGHIVPQPHPPLELSVLLRDLRKIPALPALIATAVVWNFFLNIPGPFFNVYMVENLKASATMVGIASVATTVSGLLVQRRLGKLSDRLGAHRLQLISGLLIPILPFAWVFTRVPWHVIPINIVSGVLWGAYGLASFNLLLELTPQEERARYSAVYQLFVTLALAAGAVVGGFMVTQWGYTTIFVTSAIGRLLAALLFARFVRWPVSIPNAG
ncbi:MAG TPA: MFS transporter [Anaerolineales bacterium]